MGRFLKRLFKWTLLTLFVVGAWLGYVAWDIVSFGRKDQARKCDVAIVLGAAAYDKSPSPVLKERVNHAISLYRKHVVDKILFTGGFGAGARMAESEVARDYAVREGVPGRDILIETRSHSTMENVEEAKRVMEAHHLKTAVVVSDPLQMRRAMAMMEDKGVNAASSPTPTTAYRSFDTKVKFLLGEVYKRHVYWLAKK